MSLSIYVHTPYCLQRCRYCDFTTFEAHEIYNPKNYFADLLQEVRNRHHLWVPRDVKSVYFGGGTPSLVDPEYIIAVLKEFANLGFKYLDECEITIEINPATVSETNLKTYLHAGINRFSVGAQTFNDRLLKSAGRKHSAQDTRHTLSLLKKHHLNYSFDLLFALPHQSPADLEQDLEEIQNWDPPHLSTYCLTVPEGHSMSFHRAPENEQLEMFDKIEQRLAEIDLRKYEISNFAKPGFASSHNMAYWHDQPYWGVGLSSHSYDPALGPYGTRFWNSKSIKDYAQAVHVKGDDWGEILPQRQREHLLEHEAITDLCHMYLRTRSGLPRAALQKFQAVSKCAIETRLATLTEDEMIDFDGTQWRLTPESELRSNLIFEKLTFLPEELKNDADH